MLKQPPWEIRIERRGRPIVEFQVPYHRISTKEIKRLLVMLHAHYSAQGPEEIATHFLNRRPGAPFRSPTEVTTGWWDQDYSRGYYCGSMDCFISARTKIGREAFAAMRDYHRQCRDAGQSGQ